MRIALFSEVFWPMVSGVSLTLSRLADALQARGHEVRVYSPAYPLPDGMRDRPDTARFAGKPLFLAPEVYTTTARQEEITDDLRAFAPDVVHILTEWTMGRRGLKAAKDLDLPIVMSAHTDYERYAAKYGVGWIVPGAWAYLRWFYRHAHKVLAPTAIYERLLNERGIWHTGIWTRGVDPAAFHPRFRSADFRARFGVGDDGVLVSNIGRLAPEKNLPLLLEAWERLGDRRRGAQLVLVGSGLMEPMIREARPRDVHLAGTLRGEALATAYASSDVFAFPSVTETFGNVLLEAMASGVPAVVARSGGHLEFAHDEVNCLVAAANSATDFATLLERLIDDAALRRRLGAGALATAAGREWGAIYDGLLADYADAVAVHEGALVGA